MEVTEAQGKVVVVVVAEVRAVVDLMAAVSMAMVGALETAREAGVVGEAMGVAVTMVDTMVVQEAMEAGRVGEEAMEVMEAMEAREVAATAMEVEVGEGMEMAAVAAGTTAGKAEAVVANTVQPPYHQRI